MNFGSIVPGIGGVIDSAANLWGMRYQNRSNIQQAENAREWSAWMSNTSHQREMADLQAAGLNPMLAATGGASTPQASPARIENPTPNLGFANALQAMKVFSEIQNTEAATESQKVQKALGEAQLPKMAAEARLAVSNANVIDAMLGKQLRMLGLSVEEKEAFQPHWKRNASWDSDIKRYEFERGRNRYNHEHLKYLQDYALGDEDVVARRARNEMDVQDRDYGKATLSSRIAMQLMDKMFREFEIPGARAESNAWETLGTKRSYIRDAAGVSSAFSSAGHAYRSFRGR